MILEKPIVTPTNPIVKALRTRWVLFLILEKPIVTPTNPIVKAVRGVKSYTYYSKALSGGGDDFLYKRWASSEQLLT